MLKILYMFASFIFLKYIILLQVDASVTYKDNIILKRFKRNVSSEFTDIYYDENSDIIPDNNGFEYKTFGDHISERAQQVAESFQNMWHSITDSLKHAMDALHGLFSDDSQEIYVTDDYEEQQRLQMVEIYNKKLEDNEIHM
uniref:Secreted protein n=1 Tax=Glossina brevipalpis TaxID=37001 RepID=A0A1A9WAQ6_9MUSC